MCMIEKKKKFLQNKAKKRYMSCKKMRKVENSYLLPFLCLSLKCEANTATCSRVTRKTMVPFLATLRLDSQLRKPRGNPLPLPMNGMLVYVVTCKYTDTRKKIGAMSDYGFQKVSENCSQHLKIW